MNTEQSVLHDWSMSPVSQRIQTDGLQREVFLCLCLEFHHGKTPPSVKESHFITSVPSNGDSYCQQIGHPSLQTSQAPTMVTTKHYPDLNITKGKELRNLINHHSWYTTLITILIQDLLSCWLQFTDFKPHQKVIFAHTLAQAGLAHSIQLCSWHFKKKK